MAWLKFLIKKKTCMDDGDTKIQQDLEHKIVIQSSSE